MYRLITLEANGAVPIDDFVVIGMAARKLAVTDSDLVVRIANYSSGPDEQLPQLVSITQQS
jgi:hypothetical protein